MSKFEVAPFGMPLFTVEEVELVGMALVRAMRAKTRKDRIAGVLKYFILRIEVRIWILEACELSCFILD